MYNSFNQYSVCITNKIIFVSVMYISNSLHYILHIFLLFFSINWNILRLLYLSYGIKKEKKAQKKSAFYYPFSNKECLRFQVLVINCI